MTGESDLVDSNEANPVVFAVVVSFQPDIIGLLKNLEQIAAQVEQVVLVDNASAQQDAIIARCQGTASVIPQNVNGGLGSAHNLGIEYARMHGATHVVIFDQDSFPQEGMVKSLMDAMQSLQSLESLHQKVSAVGPRYVGTNAETGEQHQSFFVKFGWLKFQRNYCQADVDSGGSTLDTFDTLGAPSADFLISSGALFSMEALMDIGLMDEQLFIDHVDTEWFLRAKSKGYSAYGVCDAWMEHGLGEQTKKVKLFFRERNVPQHKSFRYYYIFRNSILLYRRSYVSKKWIWNDVQRLLQIFVFYGLMYPPRLSNIRMMIKGIRHGLLKIDGRLKLELL